MKSKYRIKSIMEWFWLMLLSMVCSMPLVLYVTWKTFNKYSWTQEHPVAFLQIMWGLAILCLILISWLINKWIRAKKWDENGMLRLAVVAIFTVFLVMFTMDDKAIVNDYSWDDVPNPPYAEESYILLLEAFGSSEKESPQLNPLDNMETAFNDPLAHKAEIKQWWQEATKTRQVLKKLDSYDFIGDLTGEKDALRTRLANIFYLTGLIYAYTGLKTGEGYPEEGVSYLIQCHSLAKKALPFSRYLIHKMIWIAVTGRNIQEAYPIANNPNCKKEILHLLKERFEPLTEKELAIQRTFITEYLFAKDALLNQIKGDNYLNHVFLHWSTARQEKQFHNPWEKTVSRIFFLTTLKPNRTLNEIKTYFDFVICTSEKHPIDFEKLKSFEMVYGNEPKINNIGKWLLSAGKPSKMSDNIKRLLEAKTQSDLFAFYLDHRLGEKSDLKDYYTGIDYQLDEKYGARSAGPDGQFNTDDDIMLDSLSLKK